MTAKIYWSIIMCPAIHYEVYVLSHLIPNEESTIIILS